MKKTAEIVFAWCTETHTEKFWMEWTGGKTKGSGCMNSNEKVKNLIKKTNNSYRKKERIIGTGIILRRINRKQLLQNI